MTCQTVNTVQLPGANITVYCQDTDEDAVNPNLFDEDFSPAAYVFSLALHVGAMKDCVLPYIHMYNLHNSLELEPASILLLKGARTGQTRHSRNLQIYRIQEGLGWHQPTTKVLGVAAWI